MKKLLLLIIIISLTGCGVKEDKVETLKCRSSYEIEPIGNLEVEAITTVKFINDEMTDYVNVFTLNLEGKDKEAIDTIFEDMKDYYTDPEREQDGIEKIFKKGDDFVSYEQIYNIDGVSEEDKKTLGTFEMVKKEIEEKNYICE